MLEQFRDSLRRSAPTLAEDGAGALAIVVVLWGALHLPGLF